MHELELLGDVARFILRDDAVQDQPSLLQYMPNNGIYGGALMNAPCVRRL
jgi:hypothetical protein